MFADNLLPIRQRRPLALYGDRRGFLSEVSRYRQLFQGKANPAGHTTSCGFLLQDFDCPRAFKAALLALPAASHPVHLLLPEHLDEVQRSIMLHLAARVGIASAWIGTNPQSYQEVPLPVRQAFLCSNNHLLQFGSGRSYGIGELVNPFYRQEAKEIIQKRQELRMAILLREQLGNGAAILSLNSEAKGQNAKEDWEWLLPIFQQEVAAPIYVEAIDHQHLLWLLPQLPGRPLVLCRQEKQSAREAIYAACREHLAMVVLSPAQLPDRSRAARLASAEELVAEARLAGLKDEDIVIEVVTLAALTAPLLLEETLAAISLLQQELKLPLMVAISPVSRSRMLHGWSNAFYAACAIDRGAELLLLNPSQREVMGILQAANELLGRGNMHEQ